MASVVPETFPVNRVQVTLLSESVLHPEDT